MDHFFIPFGTAGFRSRMGEGSDCINEKTISIMAQATAQTFSKGALSPRAVVSYDTRLHSAEFAKLTASILAGNGYQTFLTPSAMPTPFLSFACRFLNCQTGVMITASHNPIQDNGFKVYESYGGQVLESETLLLNELLQVRSIRKSHSIQEIPQEVYLAYFNSMEELMGPAPGQFDLSLLYSPFCGAGIHLIPDFLQKYGFDHLDQVEEESVEDPNFAGMEKPNPEDPKNLKRLLSKMQTKSYDLAFASDPDADRILFLDKNSRIFTGNEIGCLVAEFLLRQGKRGMIYTTYVSTPRIDAIAAHYGVETQRFKTGFRYISHAAHLNSHSFLMGFEESLGYKAYKGGSYDKDAPHMALFVSKIASTAKKENQTLGELFDEWMAPYGHYLEDQLSISTIKGGLKEKPIDQIGPFRILKKREAVDGGLLRRWELEESITLLGRPSGTEPKYKWYIQLQGKSQEELKKKNEIIKKELLSLFTP